MRISSITLTLATTSLFLFTACGQKVPEAPIDPNIRPVITDPNAFTDTPVMVNEGMDANTTSSGSEVITQGGRSIDTSRFNSSGNGFRSIYFPFGGYGISPQMQARVNQDAAIVRSLSSGRVKVEGNCDEFGTDEYNYALGLKRAKSVKDHIVAQGADPRRMVIVSFGESNPVCSTPTDACYSQNRRVDLRLVR